MAIKKSVKEVMKLIIELGSDYLGDDLAGGVGITFNHTEEDLIEARERLLKKLPKGV